MSQLIVVAGVLASAACWTLPVTIYFFPQRMHPSVDVRRSDAMQIDAQQLIQPAMYTQGDGNAIKYVSTVKVNAPSTLARPSFICTKESGCSCHRRS